MLNGLIRALKYKEDARDKGQGASPWFLVVGQPKENGRNRGDRGKRDLRQL